MPQRRSAPTRRVATKQPTSLSLPGGHEVLLTRRHFLYGAAGVAALAAVGGGAAWAAGRSSDDDALKTLKVPESAVTAQTALEEMENYEDAVTLAGSAKLPFGTLVWCSDDAVAACLLPTETAKPLAEVGLLDLSSAECTTIIEQLHDRLKDDGISEDLIKHVAGRLGHDRRYGIDPTKIKNDLGWYPETPFEKGIVLTIDWYLDHEEWMEHITSGNYQKYYE